MYVPWRWIQARHVTGAQVDASKSSSGLVPRIYLEKLKPLCRGSALYEYKPENENCVSMRLGQKLDVYMTQGKWMLVKLDVFNGKPGGLGYVPGNYVDVFDSGKEILRPSTFKEPPREYCYLCEKSIRHNSYFQCTQCRLPNGDPYYICRDCAYRRKALFVHQTVKGDSHLFSRGTLWGGQWTCDQCLQPTDGSASFTCLVCPELTCDVFDLCQLCYNDPKVPRHEHRMAQVSAEGKLLATQASSIPTIQSNYEVYICDGCRRDIPSYVLDCKICPNPRYNLCMECAEFDRATFFHDRWTCGVPHEFQVIHRHNQSKTLPKQRAT
ncbi:hypothetical protein M407DRAFT_29525 [Tulasnella calospora MUT 4182]|uniref:SH3 domain-containing protein n=1 Tax=Tulasnella calospora MUT 4182 TaxID=1051891 RepID=A0A0C3KHA2_9AGAM|nr:hypothetical protein M407DRAFT_29525 [Tulasnella calospora MUT 4182]